LQIFILNLGYSIKALNNVSAYCPHSEEEKSVATFWLFNDIILFAIATTLQVTKHTRRSVMLSAVGAVHVLDVEGSRADKKPEPLVAAI